MYLESSLLDSGTVFKNKLLSHLLQKLFFNICSKVPSDHTKAKKKAGDLEEVISASWSTQKSTAPADIQASSKVQKFQELSMSIDQAALSFLQVVTTMGSIIQLFRTGQRKFRENAVQVISWD